MFAEQWIVAKTDFALNDKKLRVSGCNFERQHVKVYAQLLQPRERILASMKGVRHRWALGKAKMAVTSCPGP